MDSTPIRLTKINFNLDWRVPDLLAYRAEGGKVSPLQAPLVDVPMPGGKRQQFLNVRYVLSSFLH